MTKLEILYLIAAMNGAALLAVVAGTIEILRWGRERHDR